MSPNLAIYSTYCGSSKDVTFVPRRYERYPSFFYTNNPQIQFQAEAAGWNSFLLNTLPLTDDPVQSAMQSKLAKAAPHLLPALADFDYLFYLDDKMVVDESRLAELVEVLDYHKAPLSIRRHPCPPPNILHEYTVSLEQKRYYDQRLRILDYMTEELEQGRSITADNRFWTSAILRNMRHPDTVKINDMWLHHINRCGIQCQISFFFVAQHFPGIILLPDNIALPPSML